MVETKFGSGVVSVGRWLVMDENLNPSPPARSKSWKRAGKATESMKKRSKLELAEP